MRSWRQALDAAHASGNAGASSSNDEDIRLHGYSPEPMDKSAVRGFYEAIFAAFGDAPPLEFHETLWDGDAAAIRFTMLGTHRAEFMGVPATGTEIALPGITVLHFSGDKAIERWSQATCSACWCSSGRCQLPPKRHLKRDSPPLGVV